MAERADVENNFEAWADVSARLRLRPSSEQEAILHELGLSDSWRGINERWAKQINDDVGAGRMERPRRYAQMCRDDIAHRKAAIEQPKAAPPSPVIAVLGAEQPGGRDFRDALTPTTVQPTRPKLRQHETSGAVISQVAAQVRAQIAAERAAAARADGPAKGTDNFRRDLAASGGKPTQPSHHQLNTAPGVDHDEVVDAARQTEAAARWPVDRYAKLCADLQCAPHRAYELWAQSGITQAAAREHIQRDWGERLRADPTLHQEWAALVAHYSR